MSYTEIVEPDYEGLDPETTVKLWVSPDAVWGQEETEYAGWDWIEDGYCVLKSSPGRHDGQSATVITLSDSQGQREVGILRLRDDALRDARLQVVRQFETKEQRDRFVAGLNAQPQGLPDDFVEVEARTVNVGDRIFVEADPDDPDLENGTVVIKEVEIHVYEGEVQVTLVRDDETSSTFLPGEWSDHAPDEKVWVKRA